jgi:hypothetical protein
MENQVTVVESVEQCDILLAQINSYRIELINSALGLNKILQQQLPDSTRQLVAEALYFIEVALNESLLLENSLDNAKQSVIANFKSIVEKSFI